MDSDLAWVNGKSGRQSWRYHADAFQRSIISKAIYHLPFSCFRRKWLLAFITGMLHMFAKPATMATSAPSRPLQGGHVRPPLAVWCFTIVPGRRLPSCRRCSWAAGHSPLFRGPWAGAAVFHSEPIMRRDADIQHLWRQSVLGCWTRTVEQSSIAPERRWLKIIVQWIPAVVKDISVWTVGPRRSVNFINCTD